MQISTGQKIGELLIGVLIPAVLVLTWWWGVRRMVKPAMARRLYNKPPLDRLMPALLIVLCCVAASVLWSSQRWISYGLLTPLAIAVAAATVLSWRARSRQP